MVNKLDIIKSIKKLCLCLTYLLSGTMCERLADDKKRRNAGQPRGFSVIYLGDREGRTIGYGMCLDKGDLSG